MNAGNPFISSGSGSIPFDNDKRFSYYLTIKNTGTNDLILAGFNIFYDEDLYNPSR